jgi:hypothetical protein
MFQIIAEKAKTLVDQKVRFENLIQRTEAARKSGQSISLPEFEAFGWERFEEFLNRFEESLNSPLLERARNVLENAGMSLSSQMIEKIKAGLTVRREKLVELLQQMSGEVNKITITQVLERARQDIGGCLEEGKWDDLVTKVGEWHRLEQELTSIAEGKDENTPLYNAVFELALQEGPTTKIVQRLGELEKTAHELCGDLLKERIKFEKPESPANPLGSVDGSLSKIAQKKEELRQLRGEDIQLDKFIRKGSTLKEVISALEKESKRVEEDFSKDNRRATDLLERRNKLADLLKQGTRSLPADLDIKKLQAFISGIEADIRKLSEELEKNLSPDARVLIENLIGGKLPDGWKEGQIVLALQELLNKGFSFEVRRREST